jgi:hypothetical protein
MNKNREKIRSGAGRGLFALIVAGWMGSSAAEAWLVTTSLTKPSGNVLVENTSGTLPILTYPVEVAGGTKYAIGQSFTATAAWTLDKISIQYAKPTTAFMDADAKVKLILFEYNSTTFDSEAWGNYTTTTNGTALNVLYTEEFDATFADVDKTWLTFDLATNQTLAAGTQYGFLVWFSNPSGGATTGGMFNNYYSGNLYSGGGYLRVTSTGNEVKATDLNFVLHAVP